MAERSVSVLGAGTMGAGIAELCAQRGIPAALFDVNGDVLKRGLSGIEARLHKRVEKGAQTRAEADAVRARISTHGELFAAVREASLVVEAVPEDMELKARVLGDVARHAPSDCLLASNTSSLSITELGRRVNASERVLGLHFFNPPPAMPLVEIVRGLGTSPEALERAQGFVSQLGKELIVVNDAPGFATSRLGVLLGAEAIRMLETGVASVADLDKAMELGYRHPMGPLKLTDLVGLDVRLSILEHLTKEIGDQFRPPVLLRKLVRAGHLGKKTGRGFYLWREDGPVPNPELSR